MAQRPVAPLDLPDLARADIGASAYPEIRHVDPSRLAVDDGYQRNLSERSISLIRRIVSGWDWRAFKPPVVADVDGVLEVIDGQHTAIAAVTHGGIDLVPVIVVDAPERTARAAAFVRHNRDRITVTQTQLHSSLVQAGDEGALTVAQVCERAGVRILKNPPPMGRFQPGDTLAVSTIKSLVNRRFAKGAREVLAVCANAGAAPVSMGLIKAVEVLLFEPQYKDDISAERIATIIAAKGDGLYREAERFAAERRMRLWNGLASVIFMSRRRING